MLRLAAGDNEKHLSLNWAIHDNLEFKGLTGKFKAWSLVLE
jgi:hypothetical protein